MARTKAAMKSGRLTAADVARITLDGVRAGRFYLFPQPKAVAGVKTRLQALLDGGAPDNPLATDRAITNAESPSAERLRQA